MRFEIRTTVSRHLLAFTFLFSLVTAGRADSNVVVRIMAANLSTDTSGVSQTYHTPAINIFKGLKPDIVAIQEFNYVAKPSSEAQIRSLVDTAFGTNYFFFHEPSYSIPNGIVSRYPILASGSWEDHDTGISDRGFAWARIDLPGTNEIYVVSVHLKASSGAAEEARRNAEANELKDLITTNFPANAWIVVGGDMNLYSDTEAAIMTFKTFLSDSPVPADQNGDSDTNAGRAERYDRVLLSFSMTNKLVPLVMPTRTYASGLVFDSRIYTPLSEVSPVISTDSSASGMQHMGVVKDFQYTVYEGSTPIAPVITNQPQSLTITQGSNAGFSVLAGGTAPLQYQWRFASTNIGSATNTTYTRSNAQLAHAGSYVVVITNSAGSVTSAVATLTVLTAPSFTAQPQSLTVTQGNNAGFSVTAAGQPAPSYQWRFAGTNISGAISSTHTRIAAQPADAGSYTCVISNSVGSATSSVATLTVLVPPGISVQPQNQTASQGGNATFNITASGTLPLGYQWRFNSVSLAAPNASNYTRVNVQPADVGNYSVVVTNAAGGITSSPASLNLQIPSPLLSILAPGLLQWQGLSNLTYSVQSLTNVTATNWSGIGTASSPSNTIWFSNPATVDEIRIFRVTYP